MAPDDDTLDRIRAALDESVRVDPERVEILREGDDVVLRGAVATPEEASVAAMIAEREVERVRSELRVDAGLRERTTGGAGPEGEPEAAPQRSPELPSEPADDLTSDVAEALGESLPWDPPDTPSFTPTRAEERGVMGRDTAAASLAPEGPVDDPDDVEPSAPDLSAAELERSARPERKEP
ncbi:MAG TPA: BON domain-containing protein [Egibacteraceae bacterium]|nr:BON domain-containing protein [Egibacteraceae bacterium]